MCEPRLGTNVSAPSSVGEALAGSAAQTPVASMTALGPDLERPLADEILDARADDPLAVEQRAVRADPRRRNGPARERGAEHRERQPGVVLDPVVVDDPAGQALPAQVRRVVDGARRPEVLREPPVAAGAEQVVQEDPAAVEAWWTSGMP